MKIFSCEDELYLVLILIILGIYFELYFMKLFRPKQNKVHFLQNELYPISPVFISVRTIQMKSSKFSTFYNKRYYTNKREHILYLGKRSLLYTNIPAYVFISFSALQNLQQPE